MYFSSFLDMMLLFYLHLGRKIMRFQILFRQRGSWTHILGLEDVTDHPVEPSVVMSHGGLLGRVLQVLLGAAGPDHLPPGHQHHHVPDVCDVGDGPQRQVH